MKKIKNIFITLLMLLTPFLAKAQSWNPDTLAEDSGLPAGTIYGIVYNIMYWILGIFGVMAVIGFVISGIMYIISSGSEDTMKKAKQAMIYSIIGVIVALSGLVIIYAIDAALNADTNF